MNSELKKKTIFCFVGRTNAGKDTLAHMFSEEFHIPIICSYTDRPMRPTETQGLQHIFLTEKEMDEMLEKETTVAYTEIKDQSGNGYRYCTTVKQFQEIESEHMIYIIDPKGIKDLQRKYEDLFNLFVIYIYAEDIIREGRSMARQDLNFEKRNMDENMQFTEFENDPNNMDFWIMNNCNCKYAYDSMLRKMKKCNIF